MINALKAAYHYGQKKLRPLRQDDLAVLKCEAWMNTWEMEKMITQSQEMSARHQVLLDEQALCLDTLMSLVAIDESGHWATVMETDTVLPSDAQDYLHALVARA